MENQAFPVVGMIVQQLSVEDYLACRQASKKWCKKLDHETVWMYLRNSHWPDLPKVQGSWKKLGWSVINLLRGRIYSLGNIYSFRLERYSIEDHSVLFQHPFLFMNIGGRGRSSLYRTDDMRTWKQRHIQDSNYVIGLSQRKEKKGNLLFVASANDRPDRLRGVDPLDISQKWIREIARKTPNQLPAYDISSAVTGFVGETGICAIKWIRDTAFNKFHTSIIRLSDGKLLEQYKDIKIRKMVDESLGYRGIDGWQTYTENGWELAAEWVIPLGGDDKRWWEIKRLSRQLHMHISSERVPKLGWDITELHWKGKQLWSGKLCDRYSKEGVSFTPDLGFVMFKHKNVLENYYKLFYTCPPDKKGVLPAFEVRDGELVPKKKLSESRCAALHESTCVVL